MRFHPASDVFPMMPEPAYQELVDDIRDHGQSYPVRVWNDMILDGRNRWRACEELGIDCVRELFHGNEQEAIDLILSLNLQRRNLTSEQRRSVVADMHKRFPEWSQTALARKAGVHKSTVSRVLQLQQGENPEQSREDSKPSEDNSKSTEDISARSKESDRQKRAAVRAHFEKDPKAKNKDVMERCGVSSALVSRVKEEMGLTKPRSSKGKKRGSKKKDAGATDSKPAPSAAPPPSATDPPGGPPPPSIKDREDAFVATICAAGVGLGEGVFLEGIYRAVERSGYRSKAVTETGDRIARLPMLVREPA